MLILILGCISALQFKRKSCFWKLQLSFEEFLHFYVSLLLVYSEFCNSGVNTMYRNWPVFCEQSAGTHRPIRFGAGGDHYNSVTRTRSIYSISSHLIFTPFAWKVLRFIFTVAQLVCLMPIQRNGLMTQRMRNEDIKRTNCFKFKEKIYNLRNCLFFNSLLLFFHLNY